MRRFDVSVGVPNRSDSCDAGVINDRSIAPYVWKAVVVDYFVSFDADSVTKRFSQEGSGLPDAASTVTSPANGTSWSDFPGKSLERTGGFYYVEIESDLHRWCQICSHVLTDVGCAGSGQMRSVCILFYRWKDKVGFFSLKAELFLLTTLDCFCLPFSIFFKWTNGFYDEITFCIKFNKMTLGCNLIWFSLLWFIELL